jgi:hypothetical protein
MSDTETLGKRRTVRFSPALDRLLEAKASKTGKTVSELIRDSVSGDLEHGGETATEWILNVARRPVRRAKADPARDEFRRAHEERHK